MVPDHRSAAGSHDSCYLTQGGHHQISIDEMVQHRKRGHEIEAVVGERQLVAAGLQYFESLRLGLSQHRRRYVDPHSFVSVRQAVEEAPRSAAYVQYSPGGHERNRKRHPACCEVRHHMLGNALVILMGDIVEVCLLSLHGLAASHICRLFSL